MFASTVSAFSDSLLVLEWFLFTLSLRSVVKSIAVASQVWSGQHYFDSTRSGNEFVHDIAVYIGQAEVAAIVAEGEPLVIQS